MYSENNSTAKLPATRKQLGQVNIKHIVVKKYLSSRREGWPEPSEEQH